MGFEKLLELAEEADRAANACSHLPMVSAGKRVEADTYRKAYKIALKEVEEISKRINRISKSINKSTETISEVNKEGDR